MYHRISKQIGCPKVGQDPMVVYGKQGFRGLNNCIPVVAIIAGRVLLFLWERWGPTGVMGAHTRCQMAPFVFPALPSIEA